ncbi:MAG: glycosyltransferase [Lachnospiraceae bacterium]|nr:glycosyltransferase [Lachnospiraceae bacterium]
MSKAIFLCDVPVDLKEGIYKKVREQARVISSIVGSCILFSKPKGQNMAVYFANGEEIRQNEVEDFYGSVEKELKDCKIAYIRHMLPSPSQLKLIHKIKSSGCRLFYEVPTYPYFGEQIKESPHKLRTAIRIAVDIAAWPYLYSKIDRLVVIRSNKKVKIFKKMFLISNGIAESNIKPFDLTCHDKNVVNIVIVGTLYAYHGIDRLLYSLKNYYKKGNKKQVILHIVGASSEIDNLKKTVSEENIPNVIFHGTMTTEELMDFYPQMDLGVGCLALYRRNADVDTTLKVVEYLCYGLPVLTSGSFPLETERFAKVRLKVRNNNDIFSVKKIIGKLNSIRIEDRKEAQKTALSELTWSGIIRKILSGT